MPRTARNSVGGMIYHVVNRANSRRRLFYTDKDYVAFLQVLLEAHRRGAETETESGRSPF